MGRMGFCVRVLGCYGSSIPGKGLPSFLVSESIVLDAGSITRSLSLKAQGRIEHIFITHPHLDHIKDIAFLADNLAVNGVKKQLRLYSTAEVLHVIKEHLLNNKIWPDFSRIPDDKNPVIKICPIEIEHPIHVEGFTITAFNVNHTVPAVGYLVEKDGKSLFYTGDTGPAADLWKNLSPKVLDALIVDVSFPNRMRRIGIAYGHLTPELLIEELRKFEPMPKKVYVIHVKHPFARQIKKELKKLFGSKCRILKGGEKIRV